MQDGTWIASRAYDTPSTRTRCADIRKRFETVLDDLKCDGDDDSWYTPTPPKEHHPTRTSSTLTVITVHRDHIQTQARRVSYRLH